MKKKSLTKIMSCLLAGVMVTGLLAGCGSADAQKPAASEEKPVQSSASEEKPSSEEPAAEELTYPLEGGKTLSIAWAEESQVTANAKDIGETPFGKAWQEQTGVKLEVIQPVGDDGMGLLYASGDLPDIIWLKVNSYNGGAVKAIKDKIIQPINDYMEFAPDLQAVFDENPLYASLSTTDSGDIIGFPFVRGSEYLLTSAGLIIRDDWLKELNLDIPETAEEVYEALKLFKSEMGASVPLCMDSWWLNSIALEHGLFSSAFGLVRGGFYQKDGQVHWGRTEAEYKDVLAFLNKLYTEELFDPSFQTVDSATVAAYIMNGESGMTIGSTGGNLGTWLQTMANTDTEYSLAGMGPLVAENGDTPMSTYYDSPVTGYFAVITPACEDVETAVKFLNYAYTDEGSMLFNYGIEGESYTVKDGVAYYTDLIHNNPEGLSKQMAMAQYQRAWAQGPFVQEEQYMREYANMPEQIAALEQWTDSNAKDYHLHSLSIAEENISEYNKLKADLDTYISEMTLKFITGEEPIENFDTVYLPMLEELKADRVIELQQNALDLFNAR